MHPASAEGLVTEQERVGSRRIAGFLGEITLPQTHATPLVQIDGGDQEHRSSRKKFCNIRAPMLAERSGWNCVPQKFPRRTMAANGRP